MLLPRQRLFIILASLLALFLSALDTLVMGAAMPTIVADLGGLHLYSWAFSGYMLARAVSLPIFGKLADIFTNRRLYVFSIGIFLAGSLMAGLSDSMAGLTLSRVVQGIGAGGNFALVYIVLSDISPPERRGKMMSVASFVWGLASVLGPTVGGVVVSYVSWRWIFFVNIPLGGLSLIGILRYLDETREKRATVSIDYWGALSLSTAILSLLTAFMLGGQRYPWISAPVLSLFALFAAAGIGFYFAERRAEDPILSFDFFRKPAFALGNGAVLGASLVIFPVTAFMPLFVQGALGKTPAELGLVMMFLSLGWSVGALFCGQTVNWLGERPAALIGAVSLIAGSWMTAGFSAQTAFSVCAVAMVVAGVGMGFVSISTLLIVQNSVGVADLGVATSAHQFTRTLGGTVGIGIAGSLLTARFIETTDRLMESGTAGMIPPEILTVLRDNVENLFKPEIQAALAPAVRAALQGAMGESVVAIFRGISIAALFCLVAAYFLPGDRRR